MLLQDYRYREMQMSVPHRYYVSPVGQVLGELDDQLPVNPVEMTMSSELFPTTPTQLARAAVPSDADMTDAAGGWFAAVSWWHWSKTTSAFAEDDPGLQLKLDKAHLIPEEPV